MSDKILDEEILDENQTEIDEPMPFAELLSNLVQDAVLNNDPNDLACEFIDEFVLRENRPETQEILAMLEMPADSLVSMLKGFIERSYIAQLQAIDNHGLQYFEGLKTAVKKQMTELAEG